MASKSDDFTLVIEDLLNEINGAKEEFEMIYDKGYRSSNKEFRKLQLKVLKEKMHSIDDLVSQLDSIMEAVAEAELVTEDKNNKKGGGKKRRRNKKNKTRRKKGGDAEKTASAIKSVKDALGRLFKAKDDVDKLQQDKTLIADTKSAMVNYLKKAPGDMRRKAKELGSIIKTSVGKHSACLAAAILAQESCILKNIKENDPKSASGSRGYVSGTDEKPSSLINKVCSVESIQKILPNWDSYKSKNTQFGCGEKIYSDMIEISDLKDKENERRLMENPQHVADLAKIRNRQQELKRRDEIAEKTGDFVLAEGKDNIFEDEVVVLGGRRKTKRRKTKRRRNKKKRKTKKKRRKRRKK